MKANKCLCTSYSSGRQKYLNQHKHLTLCKRYEGCQWRRRKGKSDQAWGHWVHRDLSCIVSTSVACQSHHGWPCLRLCYERDPLSTLGWVDPSHSVCLQAAHPHTDRPATLCLSGPHLFHCVTTWRAAEEKWVTWGKSVSKEDHIDGTVLILLYCSFGQVAVKMLKSRGKKTA